VRVQENGSGFQSPSHGEPVRLIGGPHGGSEPIFGATSCRQWIGALRPPGRRPEA
jgi:hypothetical protein